MKRTKAELIEIMKACAESLNGKTPGGGDLLNVGIDRNDYEHIWSTIGEYQAAAELTPNTVQKALSIDEVFEAFTRVCVAAKQVPSKRLYKIVARSEGSPSITTLTRRFNDSYPQFVEAYKSWLPNRQEDFEVVSELPGFDKERVWRPPLAAAVQVERTKVPFPFLPVCLSSFDSLAAGNGEGNVALEFERRCGDAFRALGFEVKDLGQGKGRKADALAVNPTRRTGFIIDAKTRREGYKLGTEDRKFLEYVNRHVPELRSIGCDHVYLVVIGSSFKDSDLSKLSAYLTTSPVRTASFIEAQALMRIVNDSIAKRREFTLEEFERGIFSGGVIR